MKTEKITAIILPRENKVYNKPAIEMKEEVAIRTLHNLIGLFCNKILISANCSQSHMFTNEIVVRDEINVGQIGSIISCLKESTTKKNLIISSDMPLVPAGLLRLLCEKKDEADFIVPASGTETIEPLCAIYDKSLIPALTQMIEMGDYNIYNLPQYCKTKFVQVYNGNDIFRNLNIRHQLAKKK